MSTHPLNLAARFVLEMIAMVAYGYWGWELADGIVRLVPATALPLLGATLWGVFAVPNDSSRSGKTVVAVPGKLRLALEAVIFLVAVFAVLDTLGSVWATVFAAAVAVHYAVSYGRVKWLLKA